MVESKLTLYMPDGSPIDLSGVLERYEIKPEAIERPPKVLKPGRNKPCPCGSGFKFKKCCGR